MEKKINLVGLLKDCPKGMELDCSMYDNLFLSNVNENDLYPIMCYTICDGIRNTVAFTEFGEFNRFISSKCVIFPKGKTTWKGFIPPCDFKDGDIVATTNGRYIGITTGGNSKSSMPTYCVIKISGEFEAYFGHKEKWMFSRFASEEEKQKLFQAIKNNGYKWNGETKTLEKLIIPKFKIGDRIKPTYNTNQYVIKGITDTHYTLVEVKEKFKYTEPIINDKDWDLVPNKFDIYTLKPFDKVLVRDNNEQLWLADLFGFYRKTLYPFMCVGHYTNQCIPYEGNEHLLGTDDECDDYYKNW